MAKSRAELPKKVLVFLNGADLILQISEVLERHRVPEDKFGEIAEVVEGAIFDSAKLDGIPAGLSKVTGLDLTKATGLARDLVGYWLLPIEEYVGDVAGMILQWGGSVKDYQVEKVSRRLVGADKFTAEALDDVSLKFKDTAMNKRLTHVMESFVRGVRTDNDVVKVLTRSKKVGGLQMDSVQASQLVGHFKKKMTEVEIDRGQTLASARPKQPPKRANLSPPPVAKREEDISDDAMDLEKIKAAAAKPSKPAPAPVKKAPPKPVPEKQPKPRFDPATITEEEEIEAKQFAEVAKKMPAPVVPTEAAVNSVLQQVKLDLSDPEKKKKFTAVVSARMRDVRDAMETRSVLEESPENGGLGLKGRELADTVEVIEHFFDDLQQKLGAAKQKEKARFIAKERETRAARERDRTQKDQAAINQKYEKLTGLSGVSKPAPAKTALSPDSLVSAPSERPTVRDVSGSKRLVGPVDELAHMEPVTFRRLSKDPNEATLKIKDKLGLLESDSYAKKLAGIKAWKGSPINQLYLAVMKEVLLTGKAVPVVLSEKAAAGEPTLTEAEVKAILKLNNELRF